MMVMSQQYLNDLRDLLQLVNLHPHKQTDRVITHEAIFLLSQCIVTFMTLRAVTGSPSDDHRQLRREC